MREAVILAGGFGTRLRSAVPDLPKAMAPVAGKPFLEILLAHLEKKGIRHVILSVGYLAEIIESHFGDSFASLHIRYAYEDEPLGTGGALRFAMRQCREDVVLALNGDTFLDVDLEQAGQDWRHHRAPILFGVQSDDTARYGSLLTDGRRVTGFLEKGRKGPGIINAGSYLFPVTLFDGQNLPASFSLEQDFLAREISRRAFRLFPIDEPFIDIGVPEDYLLAQTYLKRYA